MRIVRGTLLNSDHYMVIGKVKIGTRWAHKSRWVKTEEMRIAVEILNEQELRLKYQKKIEDKE